MARIRSIKPEFWTSGQIIECSTNARLLFIGLWNFADDAGRHPYRPKQIKAEVFPADDFTEKDIRRMLEELSSNDLITPYLVDDKEYFFINGWHHQRIDRPQSPKHPEPIDEQSTNDHRTFAPDGIGEDRRGEDSAKPNGSTPPGAFIEIPLNDGSEHPVPVGDVEELERLYPAVDVRQELREMRAWSLSNKTKRKTKRGVSRFITNWLAREQDKGGSKKQPTYDEGVVH